MSSTFHVPRLVGKSKDRRYTNPKGALAKLARSGTPACRSISFVFPSASDTILHVRHLRKGEEICGGHDDESVRICAICRPGRSCDGPRSCGRRLLLPAHSPR